MRVVDRTLLFVQLRKNALAAQLLQIGGYGLSGRRRVLSGSDVLFMLLQRVPCRRDRLDDT